MVGNFFGSLYAETPVCPVRFTISKRPIVTCSTNDQCVSFNDFSNFSICRNVCIGRKDGNRILFILFPELDGIFQCIFWKQLRTVKIIQIVLSIEPSAYKAIVTECMPDHLVKLVTRMAILCFCITDGYSLSQLCHCPNVNRESVWVGLTEYPNFVGYGCYAILLCLTVTIGTCC